MRLIKIANYNDEEFRYKDYVVKKEKEIEPDNVKNLITVISPDGEVFSGLDPYEIDWRGLAMKWIDMGCPKEAMDGASSVTMEDLKKAEMEKEDSQLWIDEGMDIEENPSREMDDMDMWNQEQERFRLEEQDKAGEDDWNAERYNERAIEDSRDFWSPNQRDFGNSNQD